MLDSYRPISLTNASSKIMESMVTGRLKTFLEENNLININQAGFRKNHCTTDHIIRLKNEASNAISSGDYTVAVCLDFTRAFDLLWVDGLLLKLINLNIKGKILNWVKNFLENRSNQVIIIDGVLSDKFKLENGTPQGSVISPYLFLIMINDFPTLSEHTATAIFADDGTIWRSGKNLPHIIKHLQDDLIIIEAWCKKWGFIINTSKSIAIVFTKNKKWSNPTLKINESKIHFENVCTLLGVKFDSQLNWSKHIDYICDRAKARLNIMKCISGTHWGANKQTMLVVYRGLIRTLFDYACVAYDSAAASSTKKLETIQYKALLLATGGMRGTSLSALLAECGEKTLRYRRKELIVKYLVKLDYIKTNPAKSILVDQVCPPTNKKYQSLYKDTLLEMKKLIPANTGSMNCCITKPCPTKHIKIDISLSGLNKFTADKVKVCDEILNLLGDKYSDYTEIYVDGSVFHDGRVGIALHIPKLKINFAYRLNDWLLPYSAEATAILEAIQCIQLQNIPNPLIITDSLSVLQDIRSSSSKYRPQLIYTIINKLHLVYQITFLWIPSHIGFPDHDYADKLAKEATKLSITKNIEYELKELEGFVERHLNIEWIKEWRKVFSTNSYNKEFDISSSSYTWKIRSRHQETTINRLRMQCCGLKAYLHKIGVTESDLCDVCGVKEDVQHFISTCVKHSELHLKLKAVRDKKKLENKLNHILSDVDCSDIIFEYVISQHIRI